MIRSHPRSHRPVAAILAALSVFAPGVARSGPPFVTDDPVPTDLSHWEIYNFAAGERVNGATGGQAGLDLNYGGAQDLQLTAVIPLGYDVTNKTRVGLSNIELAVKYRFLHQQEGSLVPDVAFFPRVLAGTESRALGSGRTNFLLPVWVGKDLGPWSVFGGGGYDINPGGGQRNFWLSGVGVTRSVSKRLALGVEVYHHNRDADDGAAYTGVNLGALYKLSSHWSLIASGGPGVQNARSEGRYDFYAALKADY